VVQEKTGAYPTIEGNFIMNARSTSMKDLEKIQDRLSVSICKLNTYILYSSA